MSSFASLMVSEVVAVSKFVVLEMERFEVDLFLNY